MRTRWLSTPTWLWLVLLTALLPTQAVAQDADPGNWQPTSIFEGSYDWIQMSSGEWVKGEILVMYDDKLEFDSDEFGDLVLDWGDIRQIRSVQSLTIGLTGRRQVVGRVVLLDGVLTVTGAEVVHEIAPREVISITAGESGERNFWTANLFFGLTARAGNSDTFDYNAHATIRRRTVTDRVQLEYMGNRSTSGDVRLSDNDRVGASWDRIMSRRFFVRPVFGEYFRDSFQNLAHRFTIGAGAGYILKDTANVDWDVFVGPAYQSVGYLDVAEGTEDGSSTPAFVFGTSAEWEMTGWLEFDGSYGFQIVNRASGSYNHHLVASFEAEITRRLDFDITLVWDRLQDPRAESDGTVPEQDDWRFAVGLTFDF